MATKLSVDQRSTLVYRALRGESIVALAKEFGVSRTLIYRWIGRYGSVGEKGLNPKVGKVTRYWR